MINDAKTRSEVVDVMKSLLPFIAISNVVQVFQKLADNDPTVSGLLMHDKYCAELILRMIRSLSPRAPEKLGFLLSRAPWSVCVEFVKMYGNGDAFMSEYGRDMARLFVRRFVPDLVKKSGDQSMSDNNYDVFRFFLLITAHYTLHRELRMLLTGCQYEKDRYKRDMELLHVAKEVLIDHAMNPPFWGSSYKNSLNLFVGSSLLSSNDVNHYGVLFVDNLIDIWLSYYDSPPKTLQGTNVYGMLCYLAAHGARNGRCAATLLNNISRFYQLTRRSFEIHCVVGFPVAGRKKVPVFPQRSSRDNVRCGKQSHGEIGTRGPLMERLTKGCEGVGEKISDRRHSFILGAFIRGNI